MKIYERIYLLTTDNFWIRVWCAVEDFGVNPVTQLMELRMIEKKHRKEEAAPVIAEEIGKLDFCNAVEVISQKDKSGILIYPEWP